MKKHVSAAIMNKICICSNGTLTSKWKCLDAKCGKMNTRNTFDNCKYQKYLSFTYWYWEDEIEPKRKETEVAVEGNNYKSEQQWQKVLNARSNKIAEESYHNNIITDWFFTVSNFVYVRIFSETSKQSVI